MTPRARRIASSIRAQTLHDSLKVSLDALRMLNTLNVADIRRLVAWHGGKRHRTKASAVESLYREWYNHNPFQAGELLYVVIPEQPSHVSQCCYLRPGLWLGGDHMVEVYWPDAPTGLTVQDDQHLLFRSREDALNRLRGMQGGKGMRWQAAGG